MKAMTGVLEINVLDKISMYAIMYAMGGVYDKYKRDII